MTILDTIIQQKKIEIANAVKSIAELEQSEFYKRKTLSAREFILDGNRTGVIAEFKRKSPSKGVINDKADVIEVTKAYADNGASCLSVLTDEKFFGGSIDDLIKARTNNIPILRKDFIIDEYQIVEAKAIGADLILLIAACLTPQRVKELAAFARKLQLEVLLEIHDDKELEHICDEIDLIGVNNRDLKTFNVDINKSIELAKEIPDQKIKIAESGIDNIKNIQTFRSFGFQGFLIGELFMKQTNPANAFANFALQLKSKAIV